MLLHKGLIFCCLRIVFQIARVRLSLPLKQACLFKIISILNSYFVSESPGDCTCEFVLDSRTCFSKCIFLYIRNTRQEQRKHVKWIKHTHGLEKGCTFQTTKTMVDGYRNSLNKTDFYVRPCICITLLL